MPIPSPGLVACFAFAQSLSNAHTCKRCSSRLCSKACSECVQLPAVLPVPSFARFDVHSPLHAATPVPAPARRQGQAEEEQCPMQPGQRHQRRRRPFSAPTASTGHRSYCQL